jgi:hypothetical protein
MRKPRSMRGLEDFGRTRLSPNFFMRDFLHSEIANFYGVPNIPDNLSGYHPGRRGRYELGSIQRCEIIHIHVAAEGPIEEALVSPEEVPYAGFPRAVLAKGGLESGRPNPIVAALNIFSAPAPSRPIAQARSARFANHR